jgi:tRNA A37 N6-isopentenylltransferase MiaA
MAVAKEFNGGIIGADRRTVTNDGHGIAKATPDADDVLTVPHYMFSELAVDHPGHVSNRVLGRFMLEGMDYFRAFGRLPVVVGGSPLLLEAFALEADLAAEDPELFEQLQGLGLSQLIKYSKDHGFGEPFLLDSLEDLEQFAPSTRAALTKQACRRVKRHILRREAFGRSAKRIAPPLGMLVLGIDQEHTDQLDARIAERTKKMFARGLITEYKTDTATRGHFLTDLEMETIGVREIFLYPTADVIEQKITANTQRFARWQRAEFRRMPFITWVQNVQQAVAAVHQHLAVLRH